MSARHVSPQRSPTSQRLSAFVVVTVASLLAVAAFSAAKACGCDERTVTALTAAAFVAGLPLAGAVVGR